MSVDPFYKSSTWKRLRAAALRRDRYRCTVPGCGSTDRLTVDHIQSRARGGLDVLDNLRTLCGEHDASIKEDQHGNRRGRGLRMKGCFADGTPRDPNHPWYQGDPDKR